MNTMTIRPIPEDANLPLEHRRFAIKTDGEMVFTQTNLTTAIRRALDPASVPSVERQVEP